MPQAKVYDFAAERDRRLKDQAALVLDYDALPCPRCQSMTNAASVSADYYVRYQCSAGHKWRIAPDGAAMRGHVGNRYY